MRAALPRLSALAANPFESCLGLTAHEFAGFERQSPIELPGFTVHPDLVNRELGVVIEGDSWGFQAVALRSGKDSDNGWRHAGVPAA